MKFPIGRTVAYSVAGLCLAAGVYFLIEAHSFRDKLEQWTKDRPVDIPVDLSRPGEFACRFDQTCGVSHGQFVCLVVPPDTATDAKQKKTLADLRFTCQITDVNGREWLKEEFSGEPSMRQGGGEGKVLLLFFHPFEPGTYNMKITVTQGAAVLLDMPQRLESYYMVCGIDHFWALLMTLIGAGCIVTGGIIAVATAVITIVRKRRRKAQGQST